MPPSRARTPSPSPSPPPDIVRLVNGEHADPHRVLGAHTDGRGNVVIRCYRPDALGASVVLDGGERVEMTKVHDAGVFEATVAGEKVPDYSFEVRYADGAYPVEDPYRFWPTLGELDLHLIGEGRDEALWEHLGSHHRHHEGVDGASFAVWAPNARAVRVVGDWNQWDGRLHPMRSLGSSGVWELFIPGVKPGDRYKYEILTRHGGLVLKADPLAFATEVPPQTASVVWDTAYEWGDDEWLRHRMGTDPLDRPMSVYEVHLGSWRWTTDPDSGEWRPLTYRELADELGDYVVDMGFTHVEFLPVAEHPFGPSWGYQVTAYYAPTSRFGTPDDFRYLVDRLHQRGIGVIVDWVPAHFPKDAFALARFDGSALYEHADPRQGEHPDWGTLVFNFGRNEVRNFLIANALFWLKEMHVDGLRVDAVASMLYLDYSRKDGEWVPNAYGGRENLDAIAFLREMNEVVYRDCPGAMTIAEESTAWPSVSRPTYLGGLGFGFKWNMGWMHDTLEYFSKDPIHRRFHHHQLTFGLLYAFHENFVLPLSHDEVVHGKGSLLNKMPGDRWQQLANLRSLYGWMWAHPGKQLLFMGSELAQEREWSESRSLDWHVLDWAQHRGVQTLVRRLNAVYRDEPALWSRDFDPTGFSWIDANDADNSVLSFFRRSPDTGRLLVCVANLTPVPRDGYRVGLPRDGRWIEVLNTDHAAFEGSGVVNDTIEAEATPWHGLQQSGAVRLPPLGVVWLVPES